MGSGCYLLERASCYTRAVVRMRAERAYGRNAVREREYAALRAFPGARESRARGCSASPPATPEPWRERGMVRERERRLLKDEWPRATIRMMPPIRDRAGEAKWLRYDERQREREGERK